MWRGTRKPKSQGLVEKSSELISLVKETLSGPRTAGSALRIRRPGVRTSWAACRGRVRASSEQEREVHRRAALGRWRCARGRTPRGSVVRAGRWGPRPPRSLLPSPPWKPGMGPEPGRQDRRSSAPSGTGLGPAAGGDPVLPGPLGPRVSGRGGSGRQRGPRGCPRAPLAPAGWRSAGRCPGGAMPRARSRERPGPQRRRTACSRGLPGLSHLARRGLCASGSECAGRACEAWLPFQLRREAVGTAEPRFPVCKVGVVTPASGPNERPPARGWRSWGALADLPAWTERSRWAKRCPRGAG